MSRSAAMPAASSPELPFWSPLWPTWDAQPYSVRALRSSAHEMCSGALSVLGAPTAEHAPIRSCKTTSSADSEA